MELAQTDLGRYFNKLRNENTKLTEEQIKKMMKQIVKGISVRKFMTKRYNFEIVYASGRRYT